MKKVTWRKSLALAMSTAMILGLAGCGSEEAENTAKMVALAAIKYGDLSNQACIGRKRKCRRQQ